MGLLLATAVFAIFSSLPDEQFLVWGWRVPFLLGIVLLGVGMFIRVRIMESPLFANVKSKQQMPSLPVLEVLRKHPGNVLLAMGARFAENASFYIFSVFVISYATGTLNLQKNTVLTGIWLAAAVQFFAVLDLTRDEHDRNAEDVQEMAASGSCTQAHRPEAPSVLETARHERGQASADAGKRTAN